MFGEMYWIHLQGLRYTNQTTINKLSGLTSHSFDPEEGSSAFPRRFITDDALRTSVPTNCVVVNVRRETNVLSFEIST
jgi:hypothetical protein